MQDVDNNDSSDQQLVEFTTQVVAAYVSNNPVSTYELPNLIQEVHKKLGTLGQSTAKQSGEKPIPAVSIRKSLHEDYLICLEDGMKFKSLKRHLRASYNLSPEEYRAKWGLPSTYPMVAPAYSKARSTLAKNLGLGRKAEAK